MEPNNLFVYGILQNVRPGKNAILRDHEKAYAFYWTILPQKHQTVHGVLFENVSNEEFEMYDRIEGVAHGFYFRKIVDVEVYEEERIARAWVYQMDSESFRKYENKEYF